MLDLETIVMEIIASSGEARSKIFEALGKAKENKFDEAHKMIKDADSILLNAHENQTKLIADELNGNKVDINLMVIHSQDHLMSTLTTRDIIEEFISILEECNK